MLAIALISRPMDVVVTFLSIQVAGYITHPSNIVISLIAAA